MVLSQVQKERFFADGYLVVKELITPDELDALRAAYADLVLGRVPEAEPERVTRRPVKGSGYSQTRAPAQLPPPVPQGSAHNRRGTQVFPKGEENYERQRQAPVSDPLDAVVKVNVPSRSHPVFDRFVRHPKVVDLVAELMGPNIKLYYDQIFAKPPYDRANRYHQDSVFWGFFASNFQITCQIMLDDSTVENGCIRFIPGSVDFGLVDWDHLPQLLTPPVLAREEAVPLKAGDATLHHSLALHCSGPNTTASRRRGWSIHYASAETRYIGTAEETERLKGLGCLVGPEPTNGWPLIRGREFSGCI